MSLQREKKTNEEKFLGKLTSQEESVRKEALQSLRKKFYEYFITRVEVFYSGKEKVSSTIIDAFDRAFDRFGKEVVQVIDRVNGSDSVTLRSVFERYYFDVEILVYLRGINLKLKGLCENYLVKRYSDLYDVRRFRDTMEAQGFEEDYKDVFIKSIITFLDKTCSSVEKGDFEEDSTLVQFFLGIFKYKKLDFYKIKENKLKKKNINSPVSEKEKIKILLAAYSVEFLIEREAHLEDDFVGLVASFSGDKITRVYSGLSERCQQLIYFRALEEMKHQEIAKKLSISVPNARVQYNNCLKEFKNNYFSSKN